MTVWEFVDQAHLFAIPSSLSKVPPVIIPTSVPFASYSCPSDVDPRDAAHREDCRRPSSSPPSSACQREGDSSFPRAANLRDYLHHRGAHTGGRHEQLNMELRKKRQESGLTASQEAEGGGSELEGGGGDGLEDMGAVGSWVDDLGVRDMGGSVAYGSR